LKPSVNLNTSLHHTLRCLSVVVGPDCGWAWTRVTTNESLLVTILVTRLVIIRYWVAAVALVSQTSTAGHLVFRGAGVGHRCSDKQTHCSHWLPACGTFLSGFN